MPRIDDRKADQLREIEIVPGVNPHAEGSVEVSFGKTKVLVTASVEREVPRWMREGEGGWITAEYGMLPRSTHTRNRREASGGKQGGRTLEIQRLIGRSLRQAVSLKKIDGITVKIDCDVLVADGGTRTASITGAWVALAQALRWAEQEGLIDADIGLKQISAVSLGVVAGEPLLDLCYEEDSAADFDLNLVCNEDGDFIELQGTGEKRSVNEEELSQLLALGKKGLAEIRKKQLEVIA